MTNDAKQMTRNPLAILLLLGTALAATAAAQPPAQHGSHSRELPTVAALSKPGALAAYIKDEWRAGRTVRLPAGDIAIDKPIMIAAQGMRIEGNGMPYSRYMSESGWNRPAVNRATRIVSTTGATVFVIQRAQGLSIENLGIETTGVGVDYQSFTGWGSMLPVFDRVSFHGCSVGFKCADNLMQANAGDVSFRTCYWRDCEVGFQVNNQQGLNYTFTDICAWLNCGVAIDARQGGCITAIGPTAYGLRECFLKVGAAGVNAANFTIIGGRFDRTPAKQPAYALVDISKTGRAGSCHVRLMDCLYVALKGEKLDIVRDAVPPKKYRKVTIDNLSTAGQWSVGE